MKYIFAVIYIILALLIWRWADSCTGGFIFDFCKSGYTFLTYPELGIVSLFSDARYFSDLIFRFLVPLFIIISVAINTTYLYYFGLLLSKKDFIKAFITLAAVVIIPILIIELKF